MKYYANFLKRNKHLLETKRSQKYEENRHMWSLYTCFERMYEDVYTALVESGNATLLAQMVWLDAHGQITTEENAWGMATRYKLEKPRNVFGMDECGSNTNQKGDGNNDGARILVVKGTAAQQLASSTDSHFTVIPVTVMAGLPVLCVIIFKAEKLDPLMVMGHDIFGDLSGDDEEDEDDETQWLLDNTGHGKIHPFGPTVKVGDIEVDCLCLASPSGGITAELLTTILRTLDERGLTERSEGVMPHMQLDGHESRLSKELLSYISNKETEWSVCIGVPYGTAYWQVADSSEMNGAFKCALVKEKQNLVREKARRHQDAQISKYDIVPLVKRAWDQSYANVENNKKAIRERGWGPLTYNCLLHPNIAATKVDGPQQQTAEKRDELCDLNDLNLDNGAAANAMDRFVARTDVIARADKRNRERFEEGEATKAALRKNKKIEKLSRAEFRYR